MLKVLEKCEQRGEERVKHISKNTDVLYERSRKCLIVFDFWRKNLNFPKRMKILCKNNWLGTVRKGKKFYKIVNLMRNK